MSAMNLWSCTVANEFKYRRRIFVSTDRSMLLGIPSSPENGFPADTCGPALPFYGASAELEADFNSLAAPTSSSRDKSVQKVPAPA